MFILILENESEGLYHFDELVINIRAGGRVEVKIDRQVSWRDSDIVRSPD